MKKEVYITNPTDQDLVFPLNGIELPKKKKVKVEENQAKHILRTWKFLKVSPIGKEEPKKKETKKVEKKKETKKVEKKNEKKKTK
jgi:hypothetical protein